MNEPLTVFAAFAASAKRYPDHPFLQIPASACARYAQGELNFTYAEASREIATLRETYAAAGLGQGMRVALLLENRPEAFFHWFALNALGVGVVPVNPDYRAAELAFLLEHSEAVLAVSIAERVADLEAVARGIPVVDAANVGRGLDAIKARPVVATSGAPGLATECGLLYTSGTTGRPKGCILSNEYYLRAGHRYMNRGGYIVVEPGRARILTPLPQFHMNAMAGTTLCVVMSGGCLIQLDRFHPRTWWSDVAATRATGIHYLGVMPAILLELPVAPEERAHCVRYGAGANVEPKHHAAFEKRFGFPLIEGWAMTETGSGGVVSADEEPRHVGTRCFGRPPPAVEVRGSRTRRGATWPMGSPASSSCARPVRIRGADSFPATSRTTRRPPPAGRAVGGIAATWRSAGLTGACSSSTARRTSSAAAARTFPRSKWKRCCCGILPSRMWVSRRWPTSCAAKK